MITLHYPPHRKNEDYISVTDQKNSCLYLLYSKFGLPSDNPTEKISWTERFWIKTSTEHRDLNDARPYEAVHSQATLECNARFSRQVDSFATYFVRILVGKEGILDEIERAKADPDWTPFTLNFDKCNFVPIYRQPYHGAVNRKTGQFHFYIYHPEPILRGKLKETFTHLVDEIANLFATMLDITTVRRNAFAKFKTSSTTDSSLWMSDGGNGKHNDTLKAVIMMRWVEKNHNYRFRISQLSQALLYYAEKEGLVLDDDAEDSPLLTINRHLGHKGGTATARIILPDGTPQTLASARKGHATQAANGFPQLVRFHAIERELGWPTLNRGRETQSAGNWAMLRQIVENRVAAFRSKLQADVDATNKRRQAEDPNYVPAVVAERVKRAKYVAKSPKMRCLQCGKELTERGMSLHVSTAYPGYSAERPFKCRLDTCNKHFPTQQRANDHFRLEHGSKVKCPECSRDYANEHSLAVHRRDQHGVNV